MRTVLAIALIALVFGGTLVIGGDRLGAWDSPTPARSPQSDAASVHTGQTAPRGRKPASSRPALATKPPFWVAELDALCRSAEARVAAMPQPRTLAEVRRHFRELAALSRRWNRQAATGPLARAARHDPQTVRRLRQLFDEERRLIRDAIGAAERRDADAFGRLAPLMLTNGEEQSRLLVALGAQDCALSQV